MDELSTDELAALGERFGVPVDAARADRIRDEANAFLATLDGLNALLYDDAADAAGRTWGPPT